MNLIIDAKYVFSLKCDKLFIINEQHCLEIVVSGSNLHHTRLKFVYFLSQAVLSKFDIKQIALKR